MTLPISYRVSYFDTCFGTKTLTPLTYSRDYDLFRPIFTGRSLRRSFSYPVLFPQQILKKIKVQEKALLQWINPYDLAQKPLNASQNQSPEKGDE